MQEVFENNNLNELQAHNDKYLTFFIEGRLFGISISDVIEIVGIQPITPVPKFPHYAKGIINLRGQIIHLIDIRLRFNKPEVPYNERTCIIVVNIGDNSAGFIVDEVDEVIDISEENIAPPPTIHKDTSSYVVGIGKTANGIVLLLDAKRIIDENELDEMARAVHA